jgi:hypothetical protein
MAYIIPLPKKSFRFDLGLYWNDFNFLVSYIIILSLAFFTGYLPVTRGLGFFSGSLEKYRHILANHIQALNLISVLFHRRVDFQNGGQGVAVDGG